MSDTIQNITNNYTAAIQSIKQAILKSRYRAAALANREMLSLYFGIGEYISNNSRKGFWGTNAIEVISQQLQKELPGLRGFSESNMKRMRQFYETWNTFIPICPLSVDELQPIDYLTNINRPSIMGEIANSNRPLPMGDLEIDTNLLITPIRQLSTAELDMSHFLQVGFTHHCIILEKTNAIKERLFYIQKCATEFWSVEKLKYNLKANLFQQQGSIVNNFTKTLANIDFQKAALQSFKDEYLLDFINMEDPDDEDERMIENGIVRNIKKFILALGTDFAFIGNQHRMIVDEKEFFVDLLFFNRRLQSLVAIDLKRKEF
ncbi:MAG: PDDEXK nuclease domain-containing protein, partial [Dysgonamonadaceae bacterium]|nr:PDDEXK nuclease domain-containing protein [Dysgonamonadaceae bacterium]